MAATKWIKACRRGQEVQRFFRPNDRMGKKCDRIDRGMIVGVRQGGVCLSISETADLLGFLRKSLHFAENGAKNKKKNPVSTSSAGRNALLMREVRGEGQAAQS